jgi:hypothetical protein
MAVKMFACRPSAKTFANGVILGFISKIGTVDMKGIYYSVQKTASAVWIFPGLPVRSKRVLLALYILKVLRGRSAEN